MLTNTDVINLIGLPKELLRSFPLSLSSYFVLVSTCHFLEDIYSQLLPICEEEIIKDVIESDNISLYRFIGFFFVLPRGKLFERAAFYGSFNLLKFAWEKKCPWDEDTFASAARGGHFEILKWLREHDCPWDGESCSAAAEERNFEILKWLRENNCPWGDGTFASAAIGGNFEILKWLK